jgi:hypothetical protein
VDQNSRKIELYLKQERAKSVLQWVLMISFVLVLMLAVTLPPLGKHTAITGTVRTLAASQHDMGHDLKLIVIIDKGQEVLVSIPRSKFYKKGKTVKLLKREPLVWGRVSYLFRGYQDD